MFTMFNVNFDSVYKKENSTKFIAIGVILLALGIISFFNKGIGIKLVSWALCFAVLFLAYLNLKNINELRRYAPKHEIAPFLRLQVGLLICALLLLLFPQKIQGLVSSLFGLYFIFIQITKIIKGKNNPYYRFTFSNIFMLILGFTLVFSPFFLSNFIASILSIIIVFIGAYLLSTGNKLRDLK